MSDKDEHQRNVYKARDKGYKSKNLGFTLKKNVVGNHEITATKCKAKGDINNKFACCPKRLAY